MTTYYEMNEDFLIHFGVPGMKWGVRKNKKSNKPVKKSRTTKTFEKSEKNIGPKLRKTLLK